MATSKYAFVDGSVIAAIEAIPRVDGASLFQNSIPMMQKWESAAGVILDSSYKIHSTMEKLGFQLDIELLKAAITRVVLSEISTRIMNE